MPNAWTQRTPERIRTAAVVGWVAAVGGAVGAIVVRLVAPAPILPNTFGMGQGGMLAVLVQAAAFASVGALLVQRRPDNAVGKVLILSGAAYSVSMLTAALTFAAAAESPGGQAASVGGWVTVVLAFIGAASLPYLALVFPTGRAHSPRWDRLRRVLLALMLVMAMILFTQPGGLQLWPQIDNPFGIGPDLRVLFGERAILLVTAVGGIGTTPIAIVAVAARYRSAGSVERQQLKWFISAAVASLATFAVTSSVVLRPDGSAGEVPGIVYGLTGAAVPIAIGVAILRYRLYDIDRLIGRTLGYAAVTAVLATVYAVAVATVGALLGSFAQGGSVAVAAATLLVFALFVPVRRRAQLFVDRRFNRSRSNAALALTALRDRLRNDVDAGRVESDVLAVIGATFQPAHASVWLRAGVRLVRPTRGR